MYICMFMVQVYLCVYGHFVYDFSFLFFQIVKQAIGPSVLLYGMSVWKGRNKYEALHRFHRDGVVTNGCQKTINFISGANVQLISQSHKIPERLSQALLRSISLVEDESLKLSNKQDQLAFLEHVSKTL